MPPAETKAPLPDEVAGLPADLDAANRLVSIAMRELKRKKDKGDIAARITLDHIAALEAENKQLREAYGAHTLADAYSSTFPDNAEDEKHLKRQETFWRLIARSWLDDLDLYLECCEAAKQRAASTEGGAA